MKEEESNLVVATATPIPESKPFLTKEEYYRDVITKIRDAKTPNEKHKIIEENLKRFEDWQLEGAKIIFDNGKDFSEKTRTIIGDEIKLRKN